MIPSYFKKKYVIVEMKKDFVMIQDENGEEFYMDYDELPSGIYLNCVLGYDCENFYILP